MVYIYIYIYTYIGCIQPIELERKSCLSMIQPIELCYQSSEIAEF